MNKRIAIVAGYRTPFAKSGTDLASLQADDLGALIVRETLARSGFDYKLIDEMIFGNVGQPAHAANIARVVALKAGLPKDLIAMTVHRNCASGMESLTTAGAKILSGEIETALVGGTESMSNYPLMYGPKMTDLFADLAKCKTLGQRLGVMSRFRPDFLKPIVSVAEGLTDPVCNLNMGQTAEVLAREFGISRDEQDEYAVQSHLKAAKARAEGHFKNEIAPISVPPQFTTLSEDTGIRATQSREALAKLRTVFDRVNGTVTPGNACPLTDGAVAMIAMSEEKAKSLGLPVLGYLSAWAYAGLDPERMGLGPVYATAKLLKKTGLSMNDFDLVEMNEAFAAQILGNLKAFASAEFGKKHLGLQGALGEIALDKLNVNGGAIAIGHPVGASGARLVLTILHELKRRGLNRGLATLCIGGGQGSSLVLEVE